MRGGQWLLIKSRDEFAQTGWRLKLLVEVEGWNEPAPRGVKDGKRKLAAHEGVKKYSAKTKSDDVRTLSASRAFKTDELTGDVNIKFGD
jgi:hypothetical protein